MTESDKKVTAIPSTSTDGTGQKGQPKGRVAPKLQKNAAALQHQFTKHQVGQLLETRPEQAELLSRNILRKDAQGSSSRIQAAQRKLQHHMTTDKVGHLLEKRSELDHLAQQNIIKDTHIAPAIQATSRALEKNLARANLYHALKSRPTVQELQQRGIYGDIPYVEGDVGSPDDGYEQSGGGEGDYVFGQQGGDQEIKVASIHDPSQLQPHHSHPGYGGLNGQGGLGGSVGVGVRGGVPQPQGASSAYSTSAPGPQPGVHESEEVKGSGPPPQTGYQRRSKNFHLTRILLKYVATMADAGEISLQQKGVLKDLIVDQDLAILAVAECFDAEHDLNDLKDSLIHLASSRQ